MANKDAAGTLEEKDWRDLLDLIRDEKCTPFIGAGACIPRLPSGRQIATKWAAEHKYPLTDTGDLPRVAQFLAIDRYEMFPKELIKRELQDIPAPDFSQVDDPHSVLADLKLPIYITTNYDNFMEQALESRKVAPEREFCRWNSFPQLKAKKSILDSTYKPTAARPLVYHLHGYFDTPQSMVLTEGDYLDFLIGLSQNPQFFPSEILTALAGTSLLFVGYSLADWDFRVLFRGLFRSLGADLGYSHIAVQLPPEGLTGEGIELAQSYLDQYFRNIPKIKVRMYWGNARAFLAELRRRLESDDHVN